MSPVQLDLCEHIESLRARELGGGMSLTPGPWKWRSGGMELASELVDPVLRFGDSESCECWEPNDADKRLIAAAPELLAYIEWHLYDLKHGYTDSGRTTNIAALVAKIRGEK